MGNDKKSSTPPIKKIPCQMNHFTSSSCFPRKKLLARLLNYVQINVLYCEFGIKHMKRSFYTALSIGLLALICSHSTSLAGSWIWNPDDTDPELISVIRIRRL